MTFSETTAHVDTDTSDTVEMSYACTRCGDDKSESCYDGVFNKKYQKWYRHKICKRCRTTDASKKFTIRRLNDWRFRVIQNARTAMCGGGNRKYQRGKRPDWDPIDLTPEYLDSLYTKQEGKCAYFGVEFILVGGTHLRSITLDRLDCEKGYVQGNVVLACRAANLARNNSSVDDMLELVKLIKRS